MSIADSENDAAPWSNLSLMVSRLGETMSRGSLSGVSNTVQNFTPRFKSDAIRSSFSKWGESQLAWKLETLADLNESDLSFFVMTLEARCDSPDWVMSR